MAASDGVIESVLSEQSLRFGADESLSAHNFAGYAVSEAVRTTLGPNGLDALIVDDAGDFVITNDGVKILREMPVDHPGANMVIEVALAQKAEVGDGTTTAVVLTGELLREGASLAAEGVHPSLIVSGYQTASRRAQAALRKGASSIGADDADALRNVAGTSMTGKGSDRVRETLAPLVVTAFRAAATPDGVERNRIRIESIPGGSVCDSTLVGGYALGVDAVHADMPASVSEPIVALVQDTLQPERVGIDDDISVRDVAALDGIHESEAETQRQGVSRLVDAGVDIAFVNGGIGDVAARELAANGVLALRRVGFGAGDAMGKLASVTGAEPVSLSDLERDALGTAAEVTRESHAGEEHYVVRAADSDVRTLFVRGGSTRVVREAERAVEDALDALESAVTANAVLPGGGAPEMRAALALRDAATGLDSHEQLAVRAFADALEVIPRTLATNAGADPIDTITALRSRHADGDHAAGVDGYAGGVANMAATGVVEPLDVTLQAVRSATEAACMLLRIDDTISVGRFAGGDPIDESDLTVEELARKKLRSE